MIIRAIVTNKSSLRKKTEHVSLEEGYRVVDQLQLTFDKLPDTGRGFGLSANQIGISKSVCIIDVPGKSRLSLINPVITKKSDETIGYLEGCLSLPGKLTTTKRHLKIFVKADNFDNELYFGPDVDPITPSSLQNDLGVLQCITVQHEIDHLNGVLMTDSSVRVSPQTYTQSKYGRNDKVLIEKGGETQYIKYKRAEGLLAEGWRIL